MITIFIKASLSTNNSDRHHFGEEETEAQRRCSYTRSCSWPIAGLEFESRVTISKMTEQSLFVSKANHSISQ